MTAAAVYDITKLRPSWVRKINVVHVDGCLVPGECWLWQGSRSNSRSLYYGRVCIPNQKRTGYLHRVVYELLAGAIPDGLQIDHLCRQTLCCNPAHLEPVTCLENVRRGLGPSSRTECPQGHAYTEDNTYIYRRRRFCVQCRRDYMPAYNAKRKAQREATWAKYLPEQVTA